jgi:hypothetical protein
MRSVLSILVIAGVLGNARAEPANDEAIALALFNEGRALAEAGDLAHACPKFEAADRLTGWLGVELNLADCYARLGRTASAWVLFRKAAAKAEATRDDRAAYARQRAATLEPALSRLTIMPSTTPVEIRIDDVVLSGGELGVAMPVDPGEHHLVVRVSGESEPWSRTVTVAPRESVTIRIPGPQPDPRRAPRPWLAWSLGGAGAALIGTSLGLGLSAKLRYDAAVDDHCDARRACGPAGLAGIGEARRRASAATIVGGFGVALVAAGWIVHRVRREPRRLEVAPVVTPGHVAVSIGGSL